MFLIGQIHYVGKWGGGSWRWKSRVLWAPVKLHEPIGECNLGPKSNFTGQKSFLTALPTHPPITLTHRLKPLHPWTPPPLLFSPSN